MLGGGLVVSDVFGLVDEAVDADAPPMLTVPVPGTADAELGGGRYDVVALGSGLTRTVVIDAPGGGGAGAVEAVEFAPPGVMIADAAGSVPVIVPGEPRVVAGADGAPDQVVIGQFSTDGGRLGVTTDASAATADAPAVTGVAITRHVEWPPVSGNGGVVPGTMLVVAGTLAVVLGAIALAMRPPVRRARHQHWEAVG